MPKVKYDVRYLPLFYEELDRDISYIAFKLKNPDAANDLLDSVESAIMKRLKDGPESFEQEYSRKSRKYPYYRIYVKNYIIYYVVLEERGRKIMEVTDASPFWLNQGFASCRKNVRWFQRPIIK